MVINQSGSRWGKGPISAWRLPPTVQQSPPSLYGAFPELPTETYGTRANRGIRDPAHEGGEARCRTHIDAIGTLTGRLGWTLPFDDRTLLYAEDVGTRRRNVASG